MCFKFIILLCLELVFVNSINILVVTTSLSSSHYDFHKTLALALVKHKQYNVTVLTHELEMNSLPKNLTVISMKGFKEKVKSKFNNINFSNTRETFNIGLTAQLSLMNTNYVFNNGGFKMLWNYPTDFKFDLIIYDSFNSRSMYVLTERFKNSLTMAVAPFALQPRSLIFYGSYPFLTFDDSGQDAGSMFKEISLMERISNGFWTHFETFYTLYIYQYREDRLIKKHFPHLSSTLDKLEGNVSFVLSIKTNPTEDDDSKPYRPNIITAGELQILPPQSLPKDFQYVMDEATAGAVLVLLNQPTPALIKILFKAFSKLPQTFLWKLESDVLLIPDNIVVKGHLPQSDIMRHPNTKLVITKADDLSIQEALYNGIPIIAIPIDVDQMTTSAKVISRNIGLILDIKNLTEEIIGEAIAKVLFSEEYNQITKMLSESLRDQFLTPLDMITFWVEYVIHHGAASQLKASSMKISLYKSLQLEAVLLLINVLLVIMISMACLICFSVKIIKNETTSEITKKRTAK